MFPEYRFVDGLLSQDDAQGMPPRFGGGVTLWLFVGWPCGKAGGGPGLSDRYIIPSLEPFQLDLLRTAGWM